MSGTRSGTVVVRVDPPIAWLTSSRPQKLHALDRETLEGWGDGATDADLILAALAESGRTGLDG